jgi:hypothetical protein
MKQVRVVTKMDQPTDDRVDYVMRPVLNAQKMPPVADIVDEGTWDVNHERDFTFRAAPNGPTATIKQKIGTLTPNFVRVDCVTNPKFKAAWAWSSVYLTRELPPDTVAAAARTAPALEIKPGMAEAERIGRQLRYADFLTRSGFYDLAQAALDDILRAFPAQKERVVERQTAIARLRAREDFEQLKRLHNAGQYAEVNKRLATFPAENVPEDTLASFRELKAEYEGVDERSKETVKHLERCLAELIPLAETQHRDAFKEAVKTIKADLYFGSVGRLEAFLSQAKQADKLAKAGKKPDLSPSQLMGLAVTGFLLGNGAAEANADVALKLWHTRQMVLDYLRAERGDARRKLLNEFRMDSTTLDDIMRIIPTLPPVEPEEKAAGMIDKTVEVKLPGNRSRTYDLRLPPEYRHSRAYPVLIVLHKEGEKPADMIDRWAKDAAENGYILAAPEWVNKNNQGFYTYGDSGEHEVVVETIRDLRRHFQVDSDRIFLFGQGQGANMAHDVGLSHPDFFAGVSSMGANPEYHAQGYWRNCQYLPFYVVTGTNSGKNEENVHKVFEHWASRNYPMLWVTYKGRGADWFGGETANIFDWMRAKRRALPLHQLGTDGLGTDGGNEYFTVRPTDNSFYWLTTDNIDPSFIMPSFKLFRNFKAARMTATVDRARNEIRLSTMGLHHVTVWIGRNAKGENLIDFDKPVTVTPNTGLRPKTQKLEPSAAVLLEDLVNRGDRQRLFLQKIEMPLARQ